MTTGDPTQVHPWADADVLFGPLTAATPTGGAAFTINATTGWTFGGVLDGAAGFSETESMDSAGYSGWGVGEIGETRRNYVLSLGFTLMQDDAVSQSLRYDTSGITVSGGGYSGTLGQRNLQKRFKLAQEVRSNGIISRRVTKNYAEISAIGDVKRGEDTPVMIPLTFKIRPTIINNVPVFWDVYQGAPA